MPSVISGHEIDSERGHWLRVTGAGGCTCGRYVFYRECGHLYCAPRLFHCGRTIDQASGTVHLCSFPARVIHVYNIVIRGRCRQCRSNASQSNVN